MSSLHVQRTYPSNITSSRAPTNTRSSPTAGTQLPAASGQLKHIVVGHGIQNYTCAKADSAAASSSGALAVLYEITDLAPGGASPMSEAAWSALTDDVLYETDLPLNIIGNVLTKYAADAAAPFKAAGDADLALDGLASPLKAIGHHYFDAAGVPVFDLMAAAGQRLVAKKLNDTAAPAGADRGLLDTGAVAWLRLGDNGAGRSVGLSQVYRVYTSGGASIACSEANTTISVPYTAQYWFYQ